ncbi:Protein CBG26425 [Caenorhabditis briggsae]|uniref:Protein CBG26425 n=1 Tax=Caenorhabditis briggsae TaxID=6238 RepID=B6ILF8_CAEBR|nr:Protein CBG26425 [Caenorhabditis briggsae]CAS00738.1 Protein CBG26425 [Caenorhabditis briggsae]
MKIHLSIFLIFALAMLNTVVSESIKHHKKQNKEFRFRRGVVIHESVRTTTPIPGRPGPLGK